MGTKNWYDLINVADLNIDFYLYLDMIIQYQSNIINTVSSSLSVISFRLTEDRSKLQYFIEYQGYGKQLIIQYVKTTDMAE